MIEYSSRPLLVIDGDSFAHRAYHGLPKSSAGATIEAQAQSSASQTFFCDYMEASDPGLCWSAGIHWMCQPIVIVRSHPTKAGVNLTPSCAINLTCCRASLLRAALSARNLQVTRPMIS